MTRPDHDLEQRLVRLFATTPDPSSVALLDTRIAHAMARDGRRGPVSADRPGRPLALVAAAGILVASAVVGIWAIRQAASPHRGDGDVGANVAGSLPPPNGGSPSLSLSPGLTVVGLADTEWRLRAMGRAAVPVGFEADLVFTEIRAGGSAGCDRFSAPYVTDFASSLALGPVSATTVGCDDATRGLEHAYLDALGTVAGYAIGSDLVLAMSDANGATLLTFEPTAPTNVVGPWDVTMISDGTGGVEADLGMPGPTITFDPNGIVGGFDGCTGFVGGYSVHGDGIAMGPLMSTMTSCGKVKDDRARRLLMALDAVTMWSVAAGVLELRDASGAMQVEAMRGDAARGF